MFISGINWVAGEKSKSVQQTMDDTGTAPTSEPLAAGDGRRRLHAKQARRVEAAPDSSDEYGPRSPSSGESGPESDDWQPMRSARLVLVEFKAKWDLKSWDLSILLKRYRDM